MRLKYQWPLALLFLVFFNAKSQSNNVAPENDFQFTGKITLIGQEEIVGENNTPKKTMILRDLMDLKHPISLAVDFWDEKIKMLDSYSEGDIITVHLETTARFYNGRYYNSIVGWKIDDIDKNSKIENNPVFIGELVSIGSIENIGEDNIPMQTILVSENSDEIFPDELAIDFWGSKKVNLVKDLAVGDNCCIHQF